MVLGYCRNRTCHNGSIEILYTVLLNSRTFQRGRQNSGKHNSRSTMQIENTLAGCHRVAKRTFAEHSLQLQTLLLKDATASLFSLCLSSPRERSFCLTSSSSRSSPTLPTRSSFPFKILLELDKV